jgi:hypothetical protein
MICEDCGYILSPFEQKCPRCAVAGATSNVMRPTVQNTDEVSSNQQSPNNTHHAIEVPCIVCQSSKTINVGAIVFENYFGDENISLALEFDIAKIIPPFIPYPAQPKKKNSFTPYATLSTLGCLASPFIALFLWIFVGAPPKVIMVLILLICVSVFASRSYFSKIDQESFEKAMSAWGTEANRIQILRDKIWRSMATHLFYCPDCQHVFDSETKKSVHTENLVTEMKRQNVKNDRQLLSERLMKGQLPECDEPLNYKPGEQCHFVSETSLWENKYQGRSYGGVSPGVSFRIAKGVRFRLGANKGASFPMYEFESIDTGRFCITNQRIIFMGVSQSIEIPLLKLIACDLYDEGLILHRSGRKNSQFFKLSDADIAAAIVSLLINS